jgi:hypothetical protein
MWSVICTVSDNKVIYSLVQGEAPEAEFTGSRRQCLAYIRRMSAEIPRQPIYWKTFNDRHPRL